MIGRQKQIDYLNEEDIEIIYHELYRLSKKQGEPVVVYGEAVMHPDRLSAILSSVKQIVFGKEVYRSLEEKAAYLLYALVKEHVFVNGNKRMALLCTGTFFLLNGFVLEVSDNELKQRVLDVAMSNADEHKKVMVDLRKWFDEHLVRL